MNTSDTDILAAIKSLSAALIEARAMVATAESCTGGWVAQVMTSQAGSSDWFERGFVTYSNEAKQDCLAVPKQIIDQYGAVSEACALAMAEGTLTHSQASYALSITGVAGPGGGSDIKPVGMVCFGFAAAGSCSFVRTQYFKGDRESVRRQAVLYAVRTLFDLFF